VLVKGVTGNVTTMSLAPAGQTTCGDTFDALTTANLQKAVSSGSLNLGGVSLSRVGDDTGDFMTAGFGSYPVNSLIRSYGGTFGPSIGSCLAYEVSGTALVLADPVQPTGLNAGANLILTGPAGAKTVGPTATGLYPDTLAVSPAQYLAPGAYTVTNVSGGSNVGSFNWNLTLPPLVVPVVPAVANRAQNLAVTWSGGAAYPVVTIFGYTGVSVAAPVNSYVEFLCNATGSAGTFTIPSVILNLLPTGGFGTPTTPGVNIQVAGVASNTFTVAGSPGLDAGFFTALITSGSVAAIQ
jgi:hypothetical protein